MVLSSDPVWQLNMQKHRPRRCLHQSSLLWDLPFWSPPNQEWSWHVQLSHGPRVIYIHTRQNFLHWLWFSLSVSFVVTNEWYWLWLFIYSNKTTGMKWLARYLRWVQTWHGSEWEKLWELDSSLGAAKTATYANLISSNTATRRSGLTMTFTQTENPPRVALLKPWSLSRSK